MSGRNRVRAFLGLGGNIGDPRAAMARALQSLDEDDDCEVVAVSSLYRTPPWGKLDQPDFLNAVAAVDTSLAPRALLDLCLAAETRLKRQRTERWGPRTIDIDILLYGDRHVSEDGLTIPHPRMLERAFVMAPLAEIAPDLVLDDRTARTRTDALDLSGMEAVAGPGWWKAGTSPRYPPCG